MNKLSEATAEEVSRVFEETIRDVSDGDAFERAAHATARRLREAWPASIALARVFVTVPLDALPPSNRRAVEALAHARGIYADLTPETWVISLAGTAGDLPAWNDRARSVAHVGIPMVSSSFLDDIPMMSGLLASLGGDLSWVDAADSAHVVSHLGTIANIFYVRDAKTETDVRRRKVISAVDFVAKHRITTVFGIGGAFASGQLLVLLVFCHEQVPLSVVESMRGPFLRLKAATARTLRRVFMEGADTESRRLSSLAPRTDSIAPRRLSTQDVGSLRRELEALNSAYLGLESQLDERTSSLKLILDSTGDGLILIDFDGTIHDDTTASVIEWFGFPSRGQRVWDYLFGEGTPAAQEFMLGFEQLIDDVLPFELTADQMARRFTRGDATYEMSLRQVFQKGRFARVLLVVRDVTERLAAEIAEAHARELNAIVRNAVRDRRDFERFVDETSRLIAGLGGACTFEERRRGLHTLKGNAAVYGFHTFASAVHRIEGEFAAWRRSTLDAAQLAELEDAWMQALDLISDLIRSDDPRRVEITATEHEDFVDRLINGTDRRTLARTVRSWRDEPNASVLRRLAAQAERLAAQLGKHVEVRVEDDGRRLPFEPLRAFWWSLVHAIRNALDHGVEASADRVAAGKSPTARLTLRCAVDGETLRVSIEDDGGGIDWRRVRARAVSLGLPAETRAHLVEALFADGLTTREEATEISGRGVGLSAVREACRALSGDVEIESISGWGTAVRARVSLSTIHRPSIIPARLTMH